MASTGFLDPAAIPYDGRVVFTLGVVIVPILLSYLFGAIARSFNHNSSAPPRAPYELPFLGHTISFALNTEGYLSKLLKRYGNTPFGMSIGGENWYYIPHGEPVLNMFQNSRELNAKPLTTVALRDQFGMNAEDIQLYLNDDSGIRNEPAPGFEDMDPLKRIFYLNHKDLHALLSGNGLRGMTSRFVDEFIRRIHANQIVEPGDRWTELPDLYAFLRTEMFHSAVQALCGTKFFELCPNFCEEFWEFDASMVVFLRRTPRWWAPKAYATRDRALASVKKWRQHAWEHYDRGDNQMLKDGELDWEPLWGARLMRARADMFRNAGQSADGDAVMDLGMLWATNANAIPATLWSLLYIILSPNLASRVLAETSSCFDSATGSLDISALCSKPLLTSIYLETLRLTVAIAVARNPSVDGLRLGKWAFGKEATMISLGWFGGRDSSFWNTGRRLANGEDEHPLNEFWAERFLEYPDDPASGPIRKTDPATYAGAKTKEKTVEDDKVAKVITNGIQGHWYPYGGGTKICPGRFFAKQEMMAALAVMVQAFEIELVDPKEASKTRTNMKMFPTGALPPDRKVPVRIRRRI